MRKIITLVFLTVTFMCKKYILSGMIYLNSNHFNKSLCLLYNFQVSFIKFVLYLEFKIFISIIKLHEKSISLWSRWLYWRPFS